MGVRVSHPKTGRLLQSDSVPGGSDNAYDYANADPVNQVDLDGRRPICFIIIANFIVILSEMGSGDTWPD